MLIHCLAGAHRAGTAGVASLMHLCGFDARTATLVWSFAFPVSGGTDAEPTASIGALERSDVFLYDGGSVYREVSHVETTTSCCHSRMSHRSSRERCRAGLLHVGLSRERRVVSPCNR